MQHSIFKSLQAAGLLFLGLSLNACVQQSMPIIRDVQPIPSSVITRICIEHNASMDDNNINTIVTELVQAQGFSTAVRQSAFRGECQHWMRYEASWAGFVPKYLARAEIELFDRETRIGRVRYDATQSFSRPDRFGTARSKLEPLIEDMFSRVPKVESDDTDP